MARGITKVVACRMETELAEQLEQLAADAGKTTSAYLHDLVAGHVGSGALGGLMDQPSEGYAAGLRKGYHEARVAIQQALAEKWPRRK